MLKNYAIILASGSGTRMSNDLPKQFVKIAGKTILEHTIEIFEKNENIDETIVVITPEYRELAENILKKNSYKKVTKLLDGGKTRKESSYIGISSIPQRESNVVIHDCARPFLSQRIINDCISALDKYQAIDVAISSADTIIKVKDNLIENIPERKYLKRGQTPQCFKLSVIKKAHELSLNDNNFTDDCGLVLKHNLCPVYVVEGDEENIKVTYPTDIYIADKLFQLRTASSPNVENLESLKDKVIVIFGGTSGIGECISNIALNCGAKVFIASTRIGCDISKPEQVEGFLQSVLKKTDCIDYIINTAGLLKIGNLTERSYEDIQKEIAVNYLGAINVIKSSIPYLKASKGGILLFSSSSYTRGRAGYSTYSSSKAAVVNLMQALSEELYDDDIRINVINPARTATPMRFNAFGAEDKDTLLSPEIVAEKSLKVLLSDITGQVIDIRRNYV